MAAVGAGGAPGTAAGAGPAGHAPEVSVIIIFLNEARYLADAVESVFAQTFGDWELLLVDDGSSDASTAIAKAFARDRPNRIRYLDHPDHANLGMSASRNLGMQAANGRYVAFLDADDIYLPERLERHVRVLDEMPQVDMVQSDHIHWYSWEEPDRRIDEDHVRPFLSVGDRLLSPPQGLLTIVAAPLLAAGICNITVRRAVALALGGFEPQFRATYEDQVFVSKIYFEKTVYVLQAYLAKYRRHPDSWIRRLKESGELVDGVSNAASDAFHGWLRDYVRSRGERQALLEEIIDDMVARPRSGIHSRLVSRASSFLAISKRGLRAVLPRPAYKALLRWNWRLELRRARRRYEHLCAQLTELELRGKLAPF